MHPTVDPFDIQSNSKIKYYFSSLTLCDNGWKQLQICEHFVIKYELFDLLTFTGSDLRNWGSCEG